MDILKLSTCEPCLFEPVGSVTNVFFDDRCQQVFSVRSGGATGILVRGFTDSKCSTFRTEDQGPIISIKLSPDQKVLAVQRTKANVQFLNVAQEHLSTNGTERKLDKKEYSQSCKSKSSTILGFVWTSNTEIVYITSHGIEVYSVISEKRNVKMLKHLNLSISFFTFSAQSSLLVTSSTQPATTLQTFLIKNGGNVVKLPKIDSGQLITKPNQQEKIEVREKDIAILNLYSGQIFVAIIQHPSVGNTDSTPSSTNTLIHLYRVFKEQSSVSRTHVLRAPFVGGIAINIVDDLVIVHHQGSGTSALFDIALQGESDGHISHHQHLGSPLQLQVKLKSAISYENTSSNNQGITITNNTSESNSTIICYSPNWVTFVPDIIIDAKQGLMWKVQLKLDSTLCKRLLVPSKEIELCKLIGFLLQRYGSKLVLLDILLQYCLSAETNLQSVGNAFDLINREYRAFLDTQMQTNLALSASMSSFEVFGNLNSQLPSGIANKGNTRVASKVILDEADLYTNLFCPLLEELGNSRVNLKRIISFILEYIRSLEEEQIPVQHFLNELLINLLVQNGSWYQLHQLLQYHVIADSKPLACLLLSLESVYPASGQLAIDMLVRLKNSADEICEILLSKNRVLAALQFASAQNLFNIETGSAGVRARKFLEACTTAIDNGSEGNIKSDTKHEENIVFYTVFNFFQERNMLDRGCEQFKDLYQNLYAK